MGGPEENITGTVDGTNASVHYAQDKPSYTHDMNNKITSSVNSDCALSV